MKTNPAVRLRQSLGIPDGDSTPNKNFSWTKKGPGRKHNPWTAAKRLTWMLAKT